MAETVNAEHAKFQLLDWGLLLGAAGIWGASFFFIDIGLEAFEAGACNAFSNSLWMRSSLADSHQKPDLSTSRIKKNRSSWNHMDCFPLTMFPIAQQWINSSLTGMLNSAMPIFTVLIGLAVFATPTAPIQLIGVYHRARRSSTHRTPRGYDRRHKCNRSSFSDSRRSLIWGRCAHRWASPTPVWCYTRCTKCASCSSNPCATRTE